MTTQLWAIGLVVTAGLIGGLGPVYLKKGSSKIDIKNLETIYKNWFLIIGLGIYGIGTILFIPALKGGELSILYPLIGLSYVWVIIYSICLLKEKMSFLKWLGIIIIIFGVSLLGLG